MVGVPRSVVDHGLPVVRGRPGIRSVKRQIPGSAGKFADEPTRAPPSAGRTGERHYSVPAEHG
jgi:hypothetical protein